MAACAARAQRLAPALGRVLPVPAARPRRPAGAGVQHLPAARTAAAQAPPLARRRADRHRRAVISVVVPIYNEVETIPELMVRLDQALTDVGEHEIVLVDDGSQDGSWPALIAHAGRNPRLRLLRLSPRSPPGDRSSARVEGAAAGGFDLHGR